MEASESFDLFANTHQRHRQLGHHHHAEKAFFLDTLEGHVQDKHRLKDLKALYRDPGVAKETVHGLMIDAGSTGSRLHIFEWEPRILRFSDIATAVSGNKLSFPDSHSRWTDRLRPGLSSFGDIYDTVELETSIATYLDPLMDFAKTVLHEKEDQFHTFPIYLRATAGMRLLESDQRAKIMKIVRRYFYSQPFQFGDEQARVLSGEEEAIYDWTGVNFLLGDLLNQSEGSGTVSNPKHTHGALDLGGASTQISFYEPNEDVMSNLFKLQVGQAKHWNVYAHSYLMYGMNAATDRFYARLINTDQPADNGNSLFYNPCLPGDSQLNVTTAIHMDKNSMERWDGKQQVVRATLQNLNPTGNFDECMDMVEDLLHLSSNQWCEFAHKGDCSFAGVYQPDLPPTEFVAFSNYYHIWQFLKLPERATIAQLEEATRHACQLSNDDLLDFGGHKMETTELQTYCFRSVYAYQLLTKGYGFRNQDVIRATNIIGGHKVGWALGAMLYEINALPWQFDTVPEIHAAEHYVSRPTYYFVSVVLGVLAATVLLFVYRERGLRRLYEPLKETPFPSYS